MIPMENKWKKLKLIQRVSMVLALISWLVLIVPVVMDMAGHVGIRLLLAQHAWIIPLFGLFAIFFTATDIFVGYRVYLHENEEKAPRVHHKKRRKK